MFIKKKVLILISIQTINNKKQKNFGNKIENFAKIKVNIIHFQLIIKEIQMMTIIKILHNIIYIKKINKVIKLEKKNCLYWFITYLLIICNNNLINNILIFVIVKLFVFKQYL